MTVTTTGRLPRDAYETGYDVAVVGAGVVGCAIARELARRPLRVALVEAADDVGKGTSKANTAILHTGFDATPGTLEARLVREGYRLLSGYAVEAGIPVRRVGALLVAWDAEQLAALPRLAAKAERNGYHAIGLLDAAELRRREPHLGPRALGALAVPDESVICPWTTAIGYATQAVRAGVDLHLGCRVHGVGGQPGPGCEAWHEIRTDRGPLRARHLVNAAGLRSDEIDRLLGHDAFTVTPGRGQLMVFDKSACHDKSARHLVRHIVLPVPTALGKGVLVAPTVFGNVLLGPTVEDLPDKSATGSTDTGRAFLRAPHAGAARRGGHRGLRWAARRPRTRRLPDPRAPRAAVRHGRRHPFHRPDRLPGHRRPRRRTPRRRRPAPRPPARTAAGADARRRQRVAAPLRAPRTHRRRPRSTAPSSAPARASPGARCGTRWPARCHRPAWTGCAGAPGWRSAGARAPAAPRRYGPCARPGRRPHRRHPPRAGGRERERRRAGRAGRGRAGGRRGRGRPRRRGRARRGRSAGWRLSNNSRWPVACCATRPGRAAPGSTRAPRAVVRLGGTRRGGCSTPPPAPGPWCAPVGPSPAGRAR